MPTTSGHRPVFKLSPAEPDLGQSILSARDEVVHDARLSLGARLMFVIILDRSVRQASNVKPGVVTISQTKLSEVLGVGRRTIWNWKDELVRRGVIWMSSQPMPNAWPIDTYHITAIHSPKHQGDKTTIEGAWGNGYRQTRPANASFAARRNAVPLAPQFQTDEKPSFLPDNSGDRSTVVPASGETTFHAPEQSGATGRRNLVPRGAAPQFQRPEKSGATASGTTVPRGAAPDCSHRKAKEQGSSQIEGGKGSPNAPLPHDLELEKFKSRLDGMFDSKLLALEKELRGRLEKATTPASRDHWKLRLAAIKAYRLGGLPPDEPKAVRRDTTATATTTAQRMPLAKARELMQAAKSKEPALA